MAVCGILDFGVAGLVSANARQMNRLVRQERRHTWHQNLFENAGATWLRPYAAGVTLYHLLTRKYPTEKSSLSKRQNLLSQYVRRSWRTEIPGWLENILLKAVAKEAKDRFETPDEFIWP